MEQAKSIKRVEAGKSHIGSGVGNPPPEIYAALFIYANSLSPFNNFSYAVSFVRCYISHVVAPHTVSLREGVSVWWVLAVNVSGRARSQIGSRDCAFSTIQ